MKIFVSLFVFIVSVFALIFSVPALALEEINKPLSSPTTINSFELFWPISAGVVSGEQLYNFKILKEDIREIFIFSNLKKAEYNITLSEKRVLEVEKLFIDKKDYTNGKKTLDIANQKREKSLSLLKKDGENNYSGELKTKIVKSFANQKDLLTYIMLQVSDDQKGTLRDSINQLGLLLESLK